MKRTCTLVATLLATFVPASIALAHVEISPDVANIGARTTFTLTVPNERLKARTVSVAIRMPDGVLQPRGVSAGGWSAQLSQDAGHPVITWTGGTISGDAQDTFTFSAQMPTTSGATLTFPATQTYSNGDVDRWIEAQDADLPAPVVTVGTGAGAEQPATAAKDSGRTGWLIGGTVAAVVAVGALMVGRRPKRATGER